MSDFLELLRAFEGTSLKTKGGRKQLPVSVVITEIERLETRIVKLKKASASCPEADAPATQTSPPPA